MTTELDSFTIKDFESRYGVTRSNIYNRISGLRDKGYYMEPEKQGNRAVYNADQLALMDQLDQHIKGGRATAEFPAFNEPTQLSYRPTGQPQPSYKTQDTPSTELAPMTFGIASMMDAIASKVADIINSRQSIPVEIQLPENMQQPDPLANFRSLQEVADRGWLLSTSQLAPLLELKSLPGKAAFDRYGFRFTKAGKNGSETAWKVCRRSEEESSNGDRS
jgi:hypothetical protein